MKKTCLPVAALVILVFSGCTFNRAVVNPGACGQDLSAIKVGQTGYFEVLDKLGPPGLPSESGDAVQVISDRHLRYLTVERKTVRFLLGWYILFPFKWSDTQTVEELLIEFDETGTVSGIYETTRDTIWPPLQSETKRKPVGFSDLTARSK